MAPELLRPPVFQYKEAFSGEVVQDGSDFLTRTSCSPSDTQATAKALSTNRIIVLVFCHLSRRLFDEELNKKTDVMLPSANQSLLWAGLTSKAFCDVGLEILWAHQSSVCPVLKILPCFSLSDGGFYILRGPVSRGDWIRFDFYSRKVTNLVLNQPQEVVAQDVYVQLARIHPAPLLPALTALTIESINDDNVDNLTFAFHCISPSLSFVRLGTTKGLRGEIFVVSFLSREAISLHELSFQINGPFTSKAIGDLAHFKALETLTLTITTPVSHANLAKISQITTLSTLAIRFSKGATLTEKPSSFFVHGEPWALRRLQISGKSTVIDDVFTSLPLFFSQIETLDTRFLDVPATANPMPWSWAPGSLKNLKISVQCLPSRESGKLEIHLKSLSPLPLHSLQSLRLVGTELKASDADVLRICQKGRWTNLAILQLPCTALRLGSPSIAVLSTLAQWCPKLRVLCVVVDLTLRDVGCLQEKIDQNIESHPLDYLEISSILPPDTRKFNEAVVVSQYIDCLFPLLQVLAPYGGEEDDYWAGIWSMIKGYRRFRKGQPAVGNKKAMQRS